MSDITTEQPLKSTIQYISDLVDEVEKLTDEIDKQITKMREQFIVEQYKPRFSHY